MIMGILVKRAEGNVAQNSVDFGVLVAASALAWAFCLELTWLVFYTFRRWSGLYFYSILISSWGCTFHAIGWSLKYLTSAPNVLFLIIVEIGWVSMVTGQSFVLYSRLHLVVRNNRILKAVLALIIIDGIVLHGPTIVLTIGANSHVEDQRWQARLGIMERIQLPWFCVQEFIISTIYIVSTVRLLRSTYHSASRAVMRLLIGVNALCLGMDAILIGLEYTNDYTAQTSIKALLYAIKLKLEFAVLNQLMNLAHKGLTEGNRFGEGGRAYEAGSFSSNHYPDHTPHRDIISVIDHDQYKTANITGWPRGRLFGSSGSKRPLGPGGQSGGSQIETTKKIAVKFEPGWEGLGGSMGDAGKLGGGSVEAKGGKSGESMGGKGGESVRGSGGGYTAGLGHRRGDSIGMQSGGKDLDKLTFRPKPSLEEDQRALRPKVSLSMNGLEPRGGLSMVDEARLR